MCVCVYKVTSAAVFFGRGTLKPRRCTMCDEESLRYCKAYLRRRLAYGPPVERQGGETEAGAAGEQGVSGWGHLWPLGRHVQCEELRRVRKGSISPPVDGFLCDFVWQPVSLARHPGYQAIPIQNSNMPSWFFWPRPQTTHTRRRLCTVP